MNSDNVETYRNAVKDFLADGVIEQWEVEELAKLRNELNIKPKRTSQ